MITWMRERLNKEEGFTLVELMVVVLIIAILIAIAIPTFLGARERAQDRAAQSNLRNSLTAQKVYYTDTETYADAAQLQAAGIEPSLAFVAAPDPTDVGVVGVTLCDANVATDGQGMIVEVISQTGTQWGIYDIATGANAGTYYFNADTGCAALLAAPAGATDGFPPAP